MGIQTTRSSLRSLPDARAGFAVGTCLTRDLAGKREGTVVDLTPRKTVDRFGNET